MFGTKSKEAITWNEKMELTTGEKSFITCLNGSMSIANFMEKTHSESFIKGKFLVHVC